MTTSLHSPDSIAQLANEALHENVRALVGRSNQLLAALLAHLAEVDARGIHRECACSTLTAYCVYELRMSEDAAYKRARAATIAREFPLLFDMLAAGEVHLTGVLMLGPHLTAGNHVELLARARFRTKREITQLLARIAPYSDVPAVVEPIAAVPSPPRRATWATFVEALAGPHRTLRPGESPRDWLGEGDAWAPVLGESEPPGEPQGADTDCEDAETRGASAEADAVPDGSGPSRPISAPERNLVPLRYKIQFSASQEYVDLLERVRDLLSHEIPTRDLEQVQLRAMRAFVADLEKRRYGAPEQSRARRTREADRTHQDATPAAESSPLPDPVSVVAPTPSPLAVTTSVVLAPPAAAAMTEGVEAALRREDTALESHRDPPLRSGRYVPAAVRREVWERDQARCSFVDDRGTRCRETAFLEIHHRAPFARGGEPTTDNLCLMCKSHNALAAEQDFGRSFMRRKVAERRIEAGVDPG